MLLASTGAPAGPFGFAATSGYQEDGDTGLELLGHRYYDPSTGRFLTREPAKDGRNWYGYAGNNPLRRVDPKGLYFFLGLKFSLALIVGLQVDIGINIGDDGSKSFHGDVSLSAGGQIGATLSPTIQDTPGEPIPGSGWTPTPPMTSTNISIGPFDGGFSKPGATPTIGLTPIQGAAGVSTTILGGGYDTGAAGGGNESEGSTSSDPSILIPTDERMRQYLTPRLM